MQKIVPHLWFDTQAAEAAKFYTSIFKSSSIKTSSTLDGTPSGSVEMLTIALEGQEFMLLSAGPYFTFNPSVSFLVSCETKEEVDRLWAALHEGGSELMPLGAYPFSEHYVWLQDRYGLSWQLMYNGGTTPAQKITPALMFVGDQCGKAEEAIRFYASVFRGASVDGLLHYGPDEAPDKDGNLKYGAFSLEGQNFSAMDSAYDHHFSFSEAISFMVYCDSQEEIDYYWDSLSAHPESEQCGWLKDKFGFSWQIVPTIMNEMMSSKDPVKAQKVTKAFLKMKKFDIAVLKKASE